MQHNFSGGKIIIVNFFRFPATVRVYIFIQN